MVNEIKRHTGRFGARYGVSIKKRYEAVEEKQRKKHICPKCGFEKVVRVSTGIFSCKKCQSKYAGGAFYPQTLSGSIISKMVAQKTFTPELSQLMRSTETAESEDAVVTENMSDEQKIDALMQGEKSEKKSKRKAKKMENVELDADANPAANESEDE